MANNMNHSHQHLGDLGLQINPVSTNMVLYSAVHLFGTVEEIVSDIHVDKLVSTYLCRSVYTYFFPLLLFKLILFNLR